MTTHDEPGHAPRALAPLSRRFTRIAGLGVLAMSCSSPSATENGRSSEPTAGEQGQETPSAPQATASQAETVRINAYLDSLYTLDSVRHTFTTKFDETVDCIDFDAHPSVKALARAGINARNEGPPSGPPSLSALPPVDDSVAFTGQPDKDGKVRKCPAGTVPYLRVTAARIVSAGGLDPYLRSQRFHPPSRAVPPANTVCGSSSSTKSGYAWALVEASVANQGGTTIGAVYDPFTTVSTNCGQIEGQQHCEHSLDQLWVTTGSCEGSGCTGNNPVQSVELGWHVDPGVEPDRNPHLFTYYTADGYQSGCYNQECGFVPVMSPAYVPGQLLSGVVAPSVTNPKAPLEHAFQAFNPGASAAAAYHNWYIYVDGNLIGYFPGMLYTGTMQTSATDFEVGGEIYTDYVAQFGQPDVGMGSGYAPSFGPYGAAAYNRNVYYLNPGTGSGTICGTALCGNGYCYNAMPLNANTIAVCGYQSGAYNISTTNPTGGPNAACWGPYFYYGGGI